jgi:hypothetical protein
MRQISSQLLKHLIICLIAGLVVPTHAADEKPSAEAVKAAKEAELDEARMSEELDALSIYVDMPEFQIDEPVSPDAVIAEDRSSAPPSAKPDPKSAKIPRAAIPQVILMEPDSAADRATASNAPACLPPGTYVKSQSCDAEEYFPTDTVQHNTQSWSNCCSGTVQRLCTRPGLSRHNSITCL